MLKWLVAEAVAKGKEMPRTFIYCKTMGMIAQLYNSLLYDLGENAYVLSVNKKVSLLGRYHPLPLAKALEKNTQKVIESLLTPDGHITIVIVTTSLGMGVNIKDVEYIINFGPPKDIEDCIQAIGRAGRDGRNSFAILYCTGKSSAWKMFSTNQEIFKNT